MRKHLMKIENVLENRGYSINFPQCQPIKNDLKKRRKRKTLSEAEYPLFLSPRRL